MLFDGWALHLSPPPDHIEGHPFHARNNVNGITATSINDLQVLPLDPRIEADPGGVHPAGRRHAARPAERALGGGQRVVRRRLGRPRSSPGSWAWTSRRPGATRPRGSTGSSTSVKRHEAERGYDPHPIGMTMQFPVADQTQGQRAAAREPAPTGSRPATTTRSSRTAGTRWRPARRRHAGSPIRPLPTAPRWSSATPTTTRPARATRCGRGSRSCAATTRS